MASKFVCSLVTPSKEVFDEEIAYANIPAHDGLLGLANMRAPLLVKLGQGELRIDLKQGKTKRYFLAGGFAQMKDNKLTLITNEAIASEDVDKTEVEAALKEAQARIAHSDEEFEKKQAEIARNKTLIAMS